MLSMTMARPKDGVSLEDAIKHKYCCNCDEEDSRDSESTPPARRQIRETAVFMRPGAYPVQCQTSITLEGCGVSHVTIGVELADLCLQLKELYLANNALSQWEDELYLTNNGYSRVTLDPAFSHITLQRLHISDNAISEWVELERLGHAFPNLHTLVAIANPLCDIGDIGSVFRSLCTLTLNSTKLSNWSSVEALTALRDLSVLGVPLGQEMPEKERRFAIIAQMPALCWLNKSEISVPERENAEQWAIRFYQETRERPHTYQQLVDTHGVLQPLADINFSPHHKAIIQFIIDHSDWKRTEMHTVDLHQTAGQLKRWWSRQLNHPQSKLRLFYEWAEDTGCYRELHGQKRQLQAFGVEDGDRFHVQLL